MGHLKKFEKKFRNERNRFIRRLNNRYNNEETSTSTAVQLPTQPSTNEPSADIQEESRPNYSLSDLAESTTQSLAEVSSFVSEGQLNDFELLDTLGEGTFGLVSKVSRKKSGKTYALKQIQCSDKNSRGRTLKEALIMEKISHENIVKCHGSWAEKVGFSDLIFILMEFCPHGNLREAIRNQEGQHFEDSVVINWMTELFGAVKFCHDKNIIHRDIKPENILFSENRRTKLADFGLSRELTSSTGYARSKVGTYVYAAPEVLQEEKYDHSVDTWSLFCVFFELVNLKMAFSKLSDIVSKPHPNLSKFERKLFKSTIEQFFTLAASERPDISSVISELTKN